MTVNAKRIFTLLAEIAESPELLREWERLGFSLESACAGWIQIGGQDQIVDPMNEPLPTAVPGNWAGKEDRVRWVRAHFTPGEMALLYKLAHDVDGMRLERCNDIIKKEKA